MIITPFTSKTFYGGKYPTYSTFLEMGGRIKKKEKKDKGTCPETQIDLEFGPTAAARDFQDGPMRVKK